MGAADYKFRVVHNNKIVGYERLHQGEDEIHWEWTSSGLDLFGKERWERGVFGHGFLRGIYKRDQYVGIEDNNRVEMYNNDIVEFMYRGELRKDVIRRGSGGWHIGITISIYESQLTKYDEIKYSLKIVGNNYH